MTLLTEMVRLLSDEEQLVNDSANYDSAATVDHDWTQRVSKSITLTKSQLVYIQWSTTGIGANARCAGRVTIDAVPLLSTGAISTPAVAATRKVYVYLAAGTYALSFQSTQWDSPGNEFVRINAIIIGKLSFADSSSGIKSGEYWAGSQGSENVVFTENIVVPSARRLPCGTIKKYTLLAFFYLNKRDVRQSKIINLGEAVDGPTSWRIYLDNIQQTMDAEVEDYNAVATNPSFGEGCYGMLAVPVTAGATVALKLTQYEAASSAYYDYYVRWVLCPWIIPNEAYEPITLDFPVGSTLYLSTEPLDANPTKTHKIGKARIVSFGDTTDYYDTDSGIGILPLSYTFETIEPTSIQLFIAGFGGCISLVGVDLR